MRLAYRDANDDGIEDDSGLPAGLLRVYRHDGSAWTPLQDQVRSLDEHWVEGTTSAMGPFALGVTTGDGSGGGGKKKKRKRGGCFVATAADPASGWPGWAILLLGAVAVAAWRRAGSKTVARDAARRPWVFRAQ